MTRANASYDFGFPVEPSLRIGRVEAILREVIQPIPSRPTLIKMIRDGHLEGAFISSLGEYVVYEESLRNWVKSFAEKKAKPKAGRSKK